MRISWHSKSCISLDLWYFKQTRNDEMCSSDFGNSNVKKILSIYRCMIDRHQCREYDNDTKNRCDNRGNDMRTSFE